MRPLGLELSPTASSAGWSETSKADQLSDPSRAANRRSARQHGFTLVEVLVSLLVFSLGLLALAALQYHYGVDTDDNDDRAVTDDKTANDVHLDNAWNRVRAVRVRLLLVSPDDNLTEDPQAFSFIDTTGDGIPDPVTATDRRLRYVLTSTIGLRNRLP